MSKEKHTEWASDYDHRAGMEWNIHIVERDRPHMRICFISNSPDAEVYAARIIETNHIPALIKALEEIEQTTIDHVAVRIARAALAAHRKDS